MFCKNCGAEIADNAVFLRPARLILQGRIRSPMDRLRKVVIRILWEATRISRREARHRAR